MLLIRNYSDKEYWLDMGYGNPLFFEYVDLFKKMYLKYDSNLKKWLCPSKKYPELIAWLKYYTYPYTLPNTIVGEKRERFLSIYRRNEFTLEDQKELLNSEYTLFNYQLEDLNKMVKKNTNLVFSDPGTGKTLLSILYFSYFYKRGLTDCIFILAENGILYHWIKEICQYSNLFKEDEIILIDNTNKKDVKSFISESKIKIYVIAHHILQDIVLILMDKNLKKQDGSKIKKSSLKWNTFQCDLRQYTKRDKLSLIIDESHKFKNSGSILSKSVKCVTDSFSYKLILTATPFIVHFEDLWNQIHLLDTTILSSSEEEFKINISKNIGNKFGMYNIVTYDPKKIEEIQTSLSTLTIKRVKTDLPEMKNISIVNPIYFLLPYKYKNIYDAIKNDELVRIKESGVDDITLENISSKFPYLLQVLDNPLLLRGKLQTNMNLSFVEDILNKLKFENDPKVEYLDSYLSDLIETQGSKCVIYDSHPLTLNLLKEKYHKKYGCETIHGEVNLSKEDKDRIVSNFNNPKSNCRLLALSFLTSSSGLNLNASCNNLVVFSLPNNPMLWRQAIDRIYRINNTRDANIYCLLYDHTYDNIRFTSTINRVKFNEVYMNKPLTIQEIEKYLN